MSEGWSNPHEDKKREVRERRQRRYLGDGLQAAPEMEGVMTEGRTGNGAPGGYRAARGVLKGKTDDLPAEEIIRRQRDEWARKLEGVMSEDDRLRAIEAAAEGLIDSIARGEPSPRQWEWIDRLTAAVRSSVEPVKWWCDGCGRLHEKPMCGEEGE